MKYAQLLQQNRFSVITSLPRNELKLAEAALKGGAEAIKVHCNVYHRASGQVFGSYSENRGFLKSLIALCGPGARALTVTPPVAHSRARVRVS